MSQDSICQVTVSGDRCTISVRGRFDYNHNSDFRRAMEQALASPTAREFVVDLSQTEYLDSSALGTLLVLDDAAKAVGKKVVLSKASGLAKQMLDVAKFDTVFEMR